MGGLSKAVHDDNGVIIDKYGKSRAVLPPGFFAKWKESNERARGEGIPAAAAPDTGDADTGLSMSSSVTQRKKGLKGRRGLMISYNSSTGATTGTGLNI